MPPTINVQSETFCALPWLGQEVRTDGRMAICCNRDESLTGPDGRILNAHRDSLKSGFSSPKRLELRKKLSAGEAVADCSRCWRVEAAGAVSRRQVSNEIFASEIAQLAQNATAFESRPRSLDLKFSNQCNQKCRICGPDSSTLWAHELSKMFPDVPRATHEINWGRDNAELWAQLRDWLPGLTRLDLFGGEPFLIPECEKILALAVELGVASQITVRLSTNGSIFPKKLVDEIFPHFKKVAVFLSLDGIGPQFEYQRHPARWSQALDVYRKFKATNYFESILLAVSALNIFDLPRYLSFWNSIGERNIILNAVVSPEYQCISILPPQLKQKSIAQLFAAADLDEAQRTMVDAMMSLMSQGGTEHLWTEFLKVIRAHDQFRGEEFREIFPGYYEASPDDFDRSLELNA